MAKKNILLVGATGTIGYSLAKQLAQQNIHCRSLVRNSEAASSLKDIGMELVVGDLTKPETLINALTSVEKVFMCSPLSPEMVEMQLNLAAACKSQGVQNIVKISTMGASPNSKMLFAQWHGEVEQKIKELQIPYTFLRPHYFMQNTLMFKQAIKSASAIFVPMGDAKISLVDSDDVAAVACGVLTSPGHENKAYEVTGPKALSFRDIANEFSGFYGKPIEFLTLPKEISEQSMLQAGTPEWLVKGTTQLFGFFDTGDAAFVRTTVSDVARKSPTTFNEFLQKFSKYLQS